MGTVSIVMHDLIAMIPMLHITSRLRTILMLMEMDMREQLVLFVFLLLMKIGYLIVDVEILNDLPNEMELH